MMEDANFWLKNMEYLYERSFNELETVFRSEFKNSQAYRDMVLDLN